MHPEAQHFVLHNHKTPAPRSASTSPSPAAGAVEVGVAEVQDAARSYLEVMAGFVGVVDTPKLSDPAVEAAEAIAFLEALWSEPEQVGRKVAMPDGAAVMARLWLHIHRPGNLHMRLQHTRNHSLYRRMQ
jgi:hypothetical protein